MTVPRSLLALAALTATLVVPAPAGAASLVPQAAVDHTPATMTLAARCTLDLGAADAVAWAGVVHGADGLRLQAAPVAGDQSAVVGPAPETTGGRGGCPVAATSADGAALLAWSEESGRGPAPVAFAERRAGGQLGAAQPLPGAVGEQVAAARASSGAAAVGWLERESVAVPGQFAASNRTRPLVAVRDAGTAGFGAPVALGEAGVGIGLDAGSLALGIDDGGDAIAVWLRPEGPPTYDGIDVLWTSRRPAGGAWSAPQRLAEDVLRQPRLAVAPSGEAVLAIVTRAGTSVASGSARDGFGAPVPAPDAGVGTAAVAIAAGGAAVVAIPGGTRGDGFGRVEVVSRASGTSPFGAATTVALVRRRAGAGFEDLRAAISPDGRALVTWRGATRAAGTPVAVPFAALGRAGGGWERPVRVTHGCRWADGAQPAFGRDGSPRVSFMHTAFADGGDYSVPFRPRLRTVAFGPQPPADRSPPGVTLTAPSGQPLPGARRGREQRIRLAVRCSEACDAAVTARVVRGRDVMMDGDGFYPAYARLAAGRWRTLALHKVDALSYGRGAPFAAGQTIPVRLTAYACDAAGNIAHATRITRVTLPHDLYE